MPKETPTKKAKETPDMNAAPAPVKKATGKVASGEPKAKAAKPSKEKEPAQLPAAPETAEVSAVPAELLRSVFPEKSPLLRNQVIETFLYTIRTITLTGG